MPFHLVGWLKVRGKWYSKIRSKNGNGSFLCEGWFIPPFILCCFLSWLIAKIYVALCKCLAPASETSVQESDF